MSLQPVAVVIRYQSFAANAVLTHRFESVARPPLRSDGSRAGIKRCPPLRFFSALSLFGALAQACKQSSRRFTVLFRPSLSVVFAHAEQHERKALKCPTKALKELTR